MENYFNHFSWVRRFENPNLEPAGREDVAACIRELRPYKNFVDKLDRVGPRADGGYLVPKSHLDSITRAVCIGVGSANAIGFDTDLASRGVKVSQFDHIIKNYSPPEEFQNFLEFHPIGLGYETSHSMKSLKDIVTFLELSETNNLLKIDVEGDEFPALYVTPVEILKRFDVIVIELHWLRLVEYAPLNAIITKVFQNLNIAHTVVHLHSNNLKRPFICQGIYFPNVIEVTWIKRNSETNLVPNPFCIEDPNDVLTDPTKVSQHFPNPWCI